MIPIFYFIFLISGIHFLNTLKINFINQFLINIILFILFHIFILNFYLFKIELFFLDLFNLTFIFFIYAGLQKSISIKMIVDINNKKFNFENYYKIFKSESFDKRVENLVKDKFIIENKKKFYISKKAKRIKKILIFIQNIYGIKNSG